MLFSFCLHEVIENEIYIFLFIILFIIVLIQYLKLSKMSEQSCTQPLVFVCDK